MKKRNLLLGIMFAILSILSIGFKPKAECFTHASGVFTITINASGGTCEEESLTTTESGTLSSLPTPTKSGYVFDKWINSNGDTVTTSTEFSAEDTITAVYNVKSYNYTISNNSSNFSLTAKTETPDVFYTLSDSLTNVNEAINLISNDLDSPRREATVNFDSISLNEDLTLSFYQATISGTINLGSHKIICEAPQNPSTLNLSNITFSSSSSQNQIVVRGENKLYLNISNCSFRATHTNEDFSNYAIYFENPIHSIYFSDKISHQTKFFYNHENGISASTANLNLSEQTSGKLAITFPYELDGTKIFQGVSSANNFEFMAMQDNYTCSAQYLNQCLYLKVEFNINFNSNGGTINQNQLTSRFTPTETINYPTNPDISLTHHSLNGYAGIINIDSETASANSMSTIYYFNKQMLGNLLADTTESKTIYDKIKEYFSVSVPALSETTPDYGFTYYKNDASDTNYKAVNFMLENNQTPSFIAIWTKTKYTISFVENGGNDVTDISEYFETKTSIPSTTRLGYIFDGWYTTNPSDIATFDENSRVIVPSEGYTITDNITFYAKWSPETYKLTVSPNNDTQNQEINVDFDTLLKNLTQISANFYTKSGHTLISWHTSETMSDDTKIDFETFTMPNHDLTIYAKWQINQYTIELYINHNGDESLFTTPITKNYNEQIDALQPSNNDYPGYTFQGWYTDKNGQYRFNNSTTFPYLPLTMPDLSDEPNGTLKLYAYFKYTEYTITYYIDSEIYKTEQKLTIIDTIPTPEPKKSGFTFEYWCTDESLEQRLDFDIMPSHNLTLYAKFKEKTSIYIDEDIQSYTLSEKGTFKLNVDLNNFVIQYLVDGNWTINAPTNKGTYDVKIVRNEDNTYKYFETTIKGGLVITPNNLDLSIYSLVFYSIAVIELICAVILLFLRKQRKTYLTYAVILPFGVVSTSGFINFVVSLILAIFGFVLIVVQIVNLKQINNEIAKISTENKEYTPPDISQNSSISKKVEIILEQNGFVSANNSDDDTKKEQSNKDEELDLDDEPEDN